MDCLVLIFRALGTPTDAACPALTRLPHFHTAFPSWPPRPPSSLVGPGAGEAVRGLLDGMLRLDPGRRVSARAAHHSLLIAGGSQAQPESPLPPSEGLALAVCSGCLLGGAMEA